MRLIQSCSFSSSARMMPSTTLKATAMLVKTKAFWKVWRKTSLSQSAMKLWRPTQRLGRPMNALDMEKYSAMTNGYATSSTSRSSAGVTNTGPRIDSWSSHSRTRPASRGRPRGTGISSALTAMSAGEDLLHFGLGPGDGVLGRGAGDRLGDHVRQQVGVGDELDLVRGRRRPAVGVVLDALAPERSILGVGLEHRVILELLVDGQIERVAGHDVLVVDLSLAEQVPDPLLGGLDVLRELPDADVARSVGLVAAVRAAEAPVVVDAVGGDELPLLRHDIGTHGVVDPAGLALLDRLVVAGVRPRQHLGLHAVAEHLLVPLDRLESGRRVDAHGLAVLVHLRAAERPQHRAGRGDRVVVLADGDSDRVPHLLELLADRVEVFPGVGDLEARLLEEVLPIGRDEHAVVLGHGAPHPVDVGALVRRADRLAVLLLELADDVRDVHELGLVEPREVHAHLDEVVAGLGLDFGGVLLLLRAHVRDVVDLELDAGVLGEALADLRQLLVRGRREVVPTEVGDLPSLAAGRRNARGEDAGEASAGGGQETPATDRYHRSSFSFSVRGGRTLRLRTVKRV